MTINYVYKYNKDGFVVIKNILNKKKIREYLIELDRLSKILIKSYKPPYVNLTIDKNILDVIFLPNIINYISSWI